MSRKFEDILDECLNRVIGKGEDPEQCLGDYPEIAEQLEPLLRTALAARMASASVQPRESFRLQSKQRLLAQVRAAEQHPRRRRWHFPSMEWPQRWAVAVAAVLLVMLIGGGGTVAASANSMPDDLLYPVKTFVEDVRMKFAGSEMDKAEYAAKLADERIEEIAQMAEEGKQSGLQKASDRLAEHLERIAKVAAAQRANDNLEESDVAKLRERLVVYATEHPLVLEKALQTSAPAIEVAVRRVLDDAEVTYTNAIEDVNSALQVRAAQPAPLVGTKMVTGFIRVVAGEKWVVGPNVITVDADTVIGGIPKVGAWAQVIAVVSRDGILEAQKITVRTVTPSVSAVAPGDNTSVTPEVDGSSLSVKDPQLRTFGGTITKISDVGLVIGTRSVILNARTVIEGVPEVGQFARVWILVRSDGSLLAQKIVVQSNRLLTPNNTNKNDVSSVEQGAPPPDVTPPVNDTAPVTANIRSITFDGEIQRLSPTEWIVNGRSVVIDRQTVIEGVARIGLMAQISGAVSDDGFVLAQKIIVAAASNTSLSPDSAVVDVAPPVVTAPSSVKPDTSVVNPSQLNTDIHNGIIRQP